MCIDSQMLSAYLDGELKEPYRTQVVEHLEHCAACRKHLDDIKALSERVKSTAYTEEELCRKKDILLETMEKKYFQNNRISLFRRKIEMSLTQMATAAAAIVLIFVSGFMFFGTNPSQTDDILPSFAVQADSQNVRMVSSKAGSLDDYTLEEILQYLDAKGYQVDISIKGLQPIEIEAAAD